MDTQFRLCINPIPGLLSPFLEPLGRGCLAKVIMTTGYSTTDNAMEALKLGAFDYVEKPFRIDDLIDAVNRAINSTGKTEPSGPS